MTLPDSDIGWVHSPNGIPSSRFDVCKLDHLGPLLSLIGDELAKIGGRKRKRGATELIKPSVDVGVCERGIDFL